MLCLVQALLNEFDQLPIMTVLRAVNVARGDLHERGIPEPLPEVICELVRVRLSGLRDDFRQTDAAGIA